jgi:predicted nuclease of predicted toxin-antitoxin system
LKVLVDQHLPAVLAVWLRSIGLEARHLREIGMRDATDSEIWALACTEDAVVVTKDGDFVDLFHRVGGARVVWVRIQNCGNPELIARFEASWPAIVERLESGERFLELR